MNEDSLIHVHLDNVTEEEAELIQRELSTLEGDIIISRGKDELDVSKHPMAEEYVEEISERVFEKLKREMATNPFL